MTIKDTFSWMLSIPTVAVLISKKYGGIHQYIWLLYPLVN